MAKKIIEVKADEVIVEDVKAKEMSEEDKKHSQECLSLMCDLTDVLSRHNPVFDVAITSFGNIIRRALRDIDIEHKKEVAAFLTKSCTEPMTDAESKLFERAEQESGNK
jgi:uncharacterized protein YejL (UPF0352 family)